MTQPDAEALVRAYRWMLVARQVDDSQWTLRRQGKGHFVVSSADHEAIGAAAGLAVHLALDFLAPHYRDLYTQSVPLRLESSVADLSVRAAGYGMPAHALIHTWAERPVAALSWMGTSS